MGGGEGFADAVGCGAAGDVVAVERGAQGDEVEEVLAELGRERAEIFERECVEFEAFVEAEADGVADDLVGLAEGHALVGEISGRGHRVKVAGFGGALHNTEAELERAGEVGEDAEQAGEGVGDVEDLLLAFLEVFVVGEWEAFDQCRECRGGTQSRADLPRASSVRSGFFFCGIAEEPVEKASGSSTKLNSAVA